jgi:hypothetical protein
MSNKTIKITPEVRMDSKVLFLIRVDGEEMAFSDSSREALLIVDSTAAAEQKRLEKEWVKVFREDLNGGQKVIISTQTLGYVTNGGIINAATIDFIPVGHAYLVKGRHELHHSCEEKDEGADEIPLISIPDILQLLAKENAEEEDEEISTTIQEPNSLEEEPTE